jgi:formylglycine-generating enzyme required for sulfatase activity
MPNEINLCKRRPHPLANIAISLEGIEQAIENLKYRPGSIKQKALLAIRAFYNSDDTIKMLNLIDTDTLIKNIWEVGDDLSKIKSKRRNFFSLKSSINSDLKKLSKKDLNPENIIITDANIFDMSEAAKSDLLNSFTNAVKTGDIDLEQATGILKAVTDFLETFQMDAANDKSLDIIKEIKKILNKISHEILPDEEEDQIELAEDEELEEIQEEDALEDDIIEELDETEEIELAEDEELEEIQEEDALEDDIIEELDEIEEIELAEDEELEEIQEEDALEDDIIEELDETEEIELAEDEELEEIQEEDALEDDIIEELDETEEIELAEDEELEEIELPEGEDLEMVDGLDKEELKALDDFREQRELAQHFDDTLGEREKKFNIYITVPKGNYTVGTKKSLKTNLELQLFEMPEVHIGRYPVTNSLFEIFVDQTGYVTTAEKKGFGIVYHARYKKKGKTASWSKSAGSENIKDACWHQPSGPGSTLHGKRNHPVVQISIEDALAYAAWIGRRIPTEAEWESAARTDLGYKYPWGNEFKPTALNIEQSGICDTCPVDEYDNDANEFKIVDLLGNIMEWTSDMEAPPFKTKKDTRYCIAKGGAWNALPTVTISSRALFKPQFSSNTIGFRCISEICL